MSPERRQKVLLGVLGVLVLVVLWRYLLGPMLAGAADPAPPPRPRAAALGEDAGEVAGPPVLPGARGGEVPDDIPSDRALELDVAALEAAPRNYKPGRDPWRFGEVPPPPPTPEEIAERKRRAEEEQARQRAAAEAARIQAEQAEQLALQPPPPPQPPPFTLTYLGSFGPPGRRIAVFTDDKDNIYNVKEGGVLQGKFLVAHIGYESVDIQFVGFPDAPTRRLAPGS